jgi:FkbM family methyltransferase
MLPTLSRFAMHLYPFARGQGRIVDRSYMRCLRFPQGSVDARCLGGFRLRVNPNDHIGRHIYLTGQFDRTIVEVLRHFAEPHDRILDVGANIGYVSCALLHAIPTAHVVAVEPVAETFATLAHNLRHIAPARSRAVHAAVSSRDGEAFMTQSAENSGTNRLSSEGTQPVTLMTGPTLFENSGLDRLHLVKIDVEGHEEFVIESFAPVFAQHRPRAIVFEHAGDLADPDAPLRQHFAKLKYHLYGVKKGLLSWSLTRVGDEKAHDYVALSEELFNHPKVMELLHQ